MLWLLCLLYILIFQINSSTYYSEVRHLVIASSLVFDNDTIPFKFLNLSNILLDDLTIDANNINVIQDMAFDTQIFSSVFSLTLNNLRVQSLSEFTLVGFTSLTNLHMRFLTSRFVPDLLYPVSKTIYYLWLEGPISGQAHQLNFGNQSYPQLVWANLCLNLRDSLKSSTFIGLAQVEILELRKCNIEVIEQDTFNSIRERIIELDLRGNQLHQLPVGVFALLLPKPFLRISISDNPFICDCRLMELQILLVMYSSKFDKEVRCASPRLHEHQLIAETTFCGDPDPDVFLVIKCGYDTIKILRMTDLKPIVIFRSKELFIEMQRQQHEFIAGNETYIVQAIDLDAKGNPVSRYFQTCPFAVCRFVPPPQLNHRIISVCLTSGKAKLNFSPFQCVSLIQSCANNIWIDSSSKPLAITLTVVGITLAFVFGTAVVFGVLIRFPHWLRGGSQVKMMESNIYINPVPDQIDER